MIFVFLLKLFHLIIAGIHFEIFFLSPQVPVRCEFYWIFVCYLSNKYKCCRDSERCGSTDLAA